MEVLGGAADASRVAQGGWVGVATRVTATRRLCAHPLRPSRSRWAPPEVARRWSSTVPCLPCLPREHLLPRLLSRPALYSYAEPHPPSLRRRAHRRGLVGAGCSISAFSRSAAASRLTRSFLAKATISRRNTPLVSRLHDTAHACHTLPCGIEMPAAFHFSVSSRADPSL